MTIRVAVLFPRDWRGSLARHDITDDPHLVAPDPAHRGVLRAAGVPRHLGQHRVPGHHRSVRHQPAVHPVGGGELRADPRQPAAGLRPAGGPLRPLAHAHHRSPDQRRGIRRLRPGPDVRVAARRTDDPGGGRRAGVRLGPGAGDADRKRGRARTGAGVLPDEHGHGVRHGPAVGRRAGGRLRLARRLPVPGASRPAHRLVHLRPRPLRRTGGLPRAVRSSGRRHPHPGGRRAAAGHDPEPGSRLDGSGGGGAGADRGGQPGGLPRHRKKGGRARRQPRPVPPAGLHPSPTCST